MSGVLPRYYRPERAVAADASVSWVVVDEDLGLHVEACTYLAGLRGARRAFNTEKTYAGRIALYLSYCRGYGVDWSSPSLAQLMAMMRWLVNEPMPARSRRPGATARYRSEGTANAIMGRSGSSCRGAACRWIRMVCSQASARNLALSSAEEASPCKMSVYQPPFMACSRRARCAAVG
ncbi:hypothetical protein [Nonomuraea sp. B19D2]|uniref:hypothetical protein n=1 Tax=Nonomuraea sp. B19D2 TaxID=3159561 RepID=UPI0032D9B1DB